MKRSVKSACPYCGVGCGIVMEVQDGKVVKVSGDKTHPTNFGRLCTKGATSNLPLTAAGRATKPFVRRADGTDEGLGMDEAIARTAGHLRAVIDAHGPDAVSLYVSGQMSIEAQYLANKLSKGFIGTNNIESNSRLCMASAASGYKLSLGADGPPGSYQDFDKADLFFVIGANMADCHPILFLRMMDRIKAGAKLIVVDPRRNTTADKADLFLQIRPGTDLALLNGLLHLLVEGGYTDADFIAQFTDGWDAMPAFLADYTPARVAELTGIPEADIRTAARWIGEAGEWMSCWTMGINQSTHGTWNTNAICNLHLATGKICRPGSGPFSLTGQPNAMGGREVGYMGLGLPGQRSTLSSEDRAFVEQAWGVPQGTLRPEAGAGTVAMFEDMIAGRIKACWIICTNPVASAPNRKKVIAGLEACDLVITQDAYLDTETNAYANIILPGALWAEAEGVMINSERNMTLMRKAVEPPGEALPDWQIIARVACKMGYADAFSYPDAAAVFEEIRQFANPKTGYDIRGATYARLDATPIQWPMSPDATNDRNPVRYRAEDGSAPRLSFPTEHGRAFFFPRPHMDAAEMPDADFPIVLNTGRLQHQWHTLTKTGKVATLNKLNPGPFVELHPDDAAALHIADRDLVEIRSRRGRAVLPATVTDRVRPGNCFTPFHWSDVFGDDLAINAVTSDAVDPLSLQPEFKFSAVALARVSGPAEVVVRKPEAVGAAVTVAAPMPALAPEPAETMTLQAALATIERKPAQDTRVSPVSIIDAFARVTGVATSGGPELGPDDHRYLQGFLSGLQSDPAGLGAIPVLPANAPIEPGTRHYLNGLLAGLYARVPGENTQILPLETTTPTVAPGAARTDVLILWASQTGNTEEAAKRCAARLQAGQYRTRLICMEDASLEDLSAASITLATTSTFGDGDPPDNAAAFWNLIAGAQNSALATVRFAVLAFGDSSYDQFCGFGRRLDARLEELGGHRLTPRSDCEPDDADAPGEWLDRVLRAIGDDAAGESPAQAAAPVAAMVLPAVRALPAVPSAQPRAFSRKQPFLARLTLNRLLSGSGATKEVRQYAFDLAGSGMNYRAGDALGVWPTNCPELVIEILDILDLSGSEPVVIKGKGEMRIAEALYRHLEITRITRDFLDVIAKSVKAANFAQWLGHEHKAELHYWSERRQIVDALRENRQPMDAQTLVSALKPLQPRLYSISSSPLTSPQEVQLTVSTVRFVTPLGRRKGACSTFLADRARDATLPIFIQKSAQFRPPDDLSAPVIMIGPGTGVAPYRAFLQERRALGATGDNWLFFGEQHAASDFYYRDEIAHWRCDGLLTRLDLAFSRDQEEKVYVQHRMLERGAELWRWIDRGAHFYVCGDAKHMAKDVDIVLRMIVARHGGLGEIAAEAYVDGMTREKRYLRDVY